MALPCFWIRKLVGDSGKILRVGGPVIQDALKKGTLKNADVFFSPETRFSKIIDRLVKKGVDLK